MITLTGGTILLMWIGEQITSRGVGNGISLIIFAGIVARFPQHHRPGAGVGAHRLDQSAADHLLSPSSPPRWSAFIVFMERAQRRLLVQYPKRQVGNSMYRRRILASAAEAQRLGRHSADLRIVASC